MLISSAGIVLNTINYSETSLVARIFTEHHGLQSFMVKGVRKKGAAVKKNLFAPLSLVNLVYYFKEREGLQVLKEISISHHLHGIMNDMTKTSVLLFMNELLNHSINPAMPDTALFHFIEEEVLALESNEVAVAIFPLRFVVGLSRALGFAPVKNYSATYNCFDLTEGSFKNSLPPHNYYIAEPQSGLLSEFLQNNTGFASTHDSRTILLSNMLDYLKLHLQGFGDIKSHLVLAEVLGD